MIPCNEYKEVGKPLEKKERKKKTPRRIAPSTRIRANKTLWGENKSIEKDNTRLIY
jgi:hypothetical protein